MTNLGVNQERSTRSCTVLCPRGREETAVVLAHYLIRMSIMIFGKETKASAMRKIVTVSLMSRLSDCPQRIRSCRMALEDESQRLSVDGLVFILANSVNVAELLIGCLQSWQDESLFNSDSQDNLFRPTLL